MAENHTPLGLEITERTFAWSASFADDFIIHEYSIKNVGIDSDGDHYPDIERDITDFYFTVRLDADVSKLPDWGAEDVYSNIDDYVMSDGTNFDWLETIEQMAGGDHGLSEEDKDIIDGKIIAAAQEERFSRKKHDHFLLISKKNFKLFKFFMIKF